MSRRFIAANYRESTGARQLELLGLIDKLSRLNNRTKKLPGQQHAARTINDPRAPIRIGDEYAALRNPDRIRLDGKLAVLSIWPRREKITLSDMGSD